MTKTTKQKDLNWSAENKQTPPISIFESFVRVLLKGLGIIALLHLVTTTELVINCKKIERLSEILSILQQTDRVKLVNIGQE